MTVPLLLTRQFGSKLGLMVSEPFLVLAPPRAMLRYQLPKLLRVIHFFQVHELMCDDIVNNRLRCHYELPVKAKVTFVGAASPTSLLPPYDKPVVGKPKSSAQLLCLCPYKFGSLHAIPSL
jgi:hypothetical protein